MRTVVVTAVMEWSHGLDVRAAVGNRGRPPTASARRVAGDRARRRSPSPDKTPAAALRASDLRPARLDYGPSDRRSHLGRAGDTRVSGIAVGCRRTS